MEKKLKFSEFAELIGVTAKTVYKMKDREEIKTVIERVNGREIQLVVTNTEEIEKFRSMNGKGIDNNGVCEDMLTDNEAKMNNNNSSLSTDVNKNINEFFDKMLVLNTEYINRLNRVSEELTNEKAKVLYLENKASREGDYINQINELSEEKILLLQEKERLMTENNALISSKQKLETEQGRLMTRNNILTFLTGIVIVCFLLVLVGVITFNIASKKVNEPNVQKKEPVQQEIVQEVQKPIGQAVNKKR